MALNALNNIGAAQQNQNIKTADAKLQAAIANVISGSIKDVTSVAAASVLQSQTSGLKQISNNLVQGIALTQVANSGAEQIQASLNQLQSLAQQAQSPTVNPETRKQLNTQFQQTIAKIDEIVSNTSFNGKRLLDGSVSDDNAVSLDTFLETGSTGDAKLTISDVSSKGLFAGAPVNLISPQEAAEALTTVNKAITQVTSERSNIGAFQTTLDFSAANIDTAVTNQQAATSELTEADLTQASTQLSIARLQENASSAVAAQSNRISPELLKLIG